ncbi:hypothetical protein EOPP23_12480 [Endozoicomonas sp. OPT23]|nr:hypothetical protein [Endozoicomonas sp. OPT23]
MVVISKGQIDATEAKSVSSLFFKSQLTDISQVVSEDNTETKHYQLKPRKNYQYVIEPARLPRIRNAFKRNGEKIIRSVARSLMFYKCPNDTVLLNGIKKRLLSVMQKGTNIF